MIPILFECAWFSIKSYGTCIALATLVAIWVAHNNQKLMELICFEKLLDLTFYLLIGGIAGGRLLFLCESGVPLFSYQALAVWQGGLSVSGALISAFLIAVGYLRYNRIELLSTLDQLAPSVALLYSISRIGCFCAGCCHGLQIITPFSVSYTNPASLAATTLPVLPTQLVSSVALFSIFLFLKNKPQSFSGETISYFLFLIGCERFLVDFIRYDYQPYWHMLSHTQLIACIFMTSGLFLWVYSFILASYKNPSKQ